MQQSQIDALLEHSDLTRSTIGTISEPQQAPMPQQAFPEFSPRYVVLFTFKLKINFEKCTFKLYSN